MDLLIKRKSDGEVFKVWKYVLGSPSQPEEHIWCNDVSIPVWCDWENAARLSNTRCVVMGGRLR